MKNLLSLSHNSLCVNNPIKSSYFFTQARSMKETKWKTTEKQFETHQFYSLSIHPRYCMKKMIYVRKFKSFSHWSNIHQYLSCFSNEMTKMIKARGNFRNIFFRYRPNSSSSSTPHVNNMREHNFRFNVEIKQKRAKKCPYQYYWKWKFISR